MYLIQGVIISTGVPVWGGGGGGQMKFDLTLILMREQERGVFWDGRVYARTPEKSKIDLKLEKVLFPNPEEKKAWKGSFFLNVDTKIQPHIILFEDSFWKKKCNKVYCFLYKYCFRVLSTKTRERGSLANILPEEPREKGRFKREVIHVDHADLRV